MLDKTPVLTTERLRLRGFTVDDHDHFTAMWTDPIVLKYFGDRKWSREDTWARVLRNIGHWAVYDFGYLAIEEKATGKFVGETGYAYGRRVIEPSLDGIPEIGWTLVSAAHGKGYATEAVQAVVKWMDKKMPGVRTICIIDPRNTPSMRVAEKVGYKAYAETVYKDAPCVLLQR